MTMSHVIALQPEAAFRVASTLVWSVLILKLLAIKLQLSLSEERAK